MKTQKIPYIYGVSKKSHCDKIGNQDAKSLLIEIQFEKIMEQILAVLLNVSVNISCFGLVFVGEIKVFISALEVHKSQEIKRRIEMQIAKTLHVKYSISGNVTLKICCYFFLCQHDFCSLHN